jgi:hypothetical protein
MGGSGGSCGTSRSSFLSRCLDACRATVRRACRAPGKLARSLHAALRHPEPSLEPVPSPEPHPPQPLPDPKADGGSALDAEKLEVLSHWGTGLQTDARAEVAAAGRAILLLIDEIERLHVLLWGQRLAADEASEPSDQGG